MELERYVRVGCGRSGAFRSVWIETCLAFVLLLAFLGPVCGQTLEPEEEEIEIERTVTLELNLLDVEIVPVPATIAIARFRVDAGPYRGSMFSLAYDYGRPVRLRSWDVHDASGYHRIGGARVVEPALGQWDMLLRPDSYAPVESIVATLTQHDLNEDEKDRRWHFTAIESIVPRGWDETPGAADGRHTPPLPPDR